MFLSMPEHETDLPAPFAVPHARYWRALSTSTELPWFVMSVAIGTSDDQCLQTVLVAGDRELAGVLGASQDSVNDLVCLIHRVEQDRPVIDFLRIREVWDGSYDDEGLNPCVILVGDDGHDYLGPFMDVDQGATRQRLVRRIGF